MVGGARNRISMGWRFGEHPAPQLPFADVKKQSRGGDQEEVSIDRDLHHLLRAPTVKAETHLTRSMAM